MSELFQLVLQGAWESKRIAARADSDSAVSRRERIFVDGGFRYRSKFRSERNFLETWIGDRDSVEDADVASQVFNHIQLDRDKNLSDFAFALDWVHNASSSEGLLQLDIFAAFGGRRDHMFLNIQECGMFLYPLERPFFCVLHPFCVFANVPFSFDLKPGQPFSLAAFTYPQSVHVAGARYSGDLTLTRPSHGLSNIADASTVRVRPEGGTIALLLGMEDPSVG